MIDVQRVRHCSACNLSFGLRERRYEFDGQVVHKDPCLSQLQRRSEERTGRLDVNILGRQTYRNPCSG